MIPQRPCLRATQAEGGPWHSVRRTGPDTSPATKMVARGGTRSASTARISSFSGFSMLPNTNAQLCGRRCAGAIPVGRPWSSPVAPGNVGRQVAICSSADGERKKDAGGARVSASASAAQGGAARHRTTRPRPDHARGRPPRSLAGPTSCSGAIWRVRRRADRPPIPTRASFIMTILGIMRPRRGRPGARPPGPGATFAEGVPGRDRQAPGNAGDSRSPGRPAPWSKQPVPVPGHLGTPLARLLAAWGIREALFGCWGKRTGSAVRAVRQTTAGRRSVPQGPKRAGEPKRAGQ